MKNITRIVECVFLVLLAACAESGGDSYLQQITGKNLAITISGSRSFNPDIVHGHIDHYVLSITAPDLNTPFVQQYGGDAESASILGIPKGVDRILSVEAFNPNGIVIRRGIREGISILPGQFTHVEIVMLPVPIFTNLTDKSAMANSRLVFEVFSEPGSQLEVEHQNAGQSVAAILDKETGKSLVNTSNPQGLFSLVPDPMDYGVHTFTVSDLKTGESSSVTISLYSNTVRAGMGVNSGGQLGVQGDDLVMSALGQPYYRNADESEGHLGNVTLLDIVDTLY